MHTHGFYWAGKPNERLKELSIMGFSNALIAEILSKEFNYEINPKMVIETRSRIGATRFMLELDKEVKVFKELSLPMDNYMVSCDYHSPAHSEMWVNLYLAIAEKFKIKKNIVIGDLFEFHFIMHHYTELARSLDKEVIQAQPVINALDYFDENILLQGNHEARVGRGTNSLIQANHLFKLFGAEIWEKKFKYSTYDKLNIGDDWMAVHPKSYSQVSGSVAIRLAEKFIKNVIGINPWGMSLGLAGLLRFLRCIEFNSQTIYNASDHEKEMFRLLISECGFPPTKYLFSRYENKLHTILKFKNDAFITYDFEDFYHASLIYEKCTLDFILKHFGDDDVYVARDSGF